MAKGKGSGKGMFKVGNFPVSDASVLIALERIGHLSLLRQLFVKVIIPPKVCSEVFKGRTKPKWIDVKRPHKSVVINIVQKTGLHPDKGETEAIALAWQQKTVLLIDDLKGRRAAEKFKIPFMGTLRLLVEAKRKGFIPKVSPLLCALEQTGRYIDKRLRQWVLEEAGE